jgi:AraC-like DNA-binding protein
MGQELLGSALTFLASRANRVSPREDNMLHTRALVLVRHYLHTHLETPIGVTELATLASISRFRLTRQFQRAFGLPLHAYHLQLRLAEAKRRLRFGDSIAEVAASLGFTDQSHFHRRFRRSFGVTPGTWRRSAAVKYQEGQPASSGRRGL